MSQNFSGQFGAANPNLDQPFSGYSNVSLDQPLGNATQHVQKVENGEGLSQLHSQVPFGGYNSQNINNLQGNAIGQPTPATQGYQQHALQNARPPTVVDPLPVDFRSNPFWSQPVNLEHPNGSHVTTTFAQVYLRSPDAHPRIWQLYHALHAPQRQINQFNISKRVSAGQSQSAQPAPFQHVGATEAVAGSIPKKKSTKVKGKKFKPTTASGKTTITATTAAAMNAPPTYTMDNDLDTPQKARDYLAYIDPADVHALTFQNDDFEDVLENKKHQFIGGMFDALTHPYSQDPPQGVALTTEARNKYHKQQDTQMTKVLHSMQTAPQIKAAKALCSLLFDTVMQVHRVGVPKEIYAGYQFFVRKNRQVDRKYRLDLASICSERMKKMVAGIKASKLIAMDVLEQKNFHRMARDPDFYLGEKFTYLRSNKTRQANIDRHNMQDEENAQYEAELASTAAAGVHVGEKRKRDAIEAAAAEMDFESEDEDEGGYGYDDEDEDENETLGEDFGGLDKEELGNMLKRAYR